MDSRDRAARGGRAPRSAPGSDRLHGVFIEVLDGSVQVLFALNPPERPTSGAGSAGRRLLARKRVLEVDVPCAPWGKVRRLVVELPAGEGPRLWIHEVGERYPTGVEDTMVLCEDNMVLAYFPEDSLDGLCFDRSMQAYSATGRLRQSSAAPVVLMALDDRRNGLRRAAG